MISTPKWIKTHEQNIIDLFFGFVMLEVSDFVDVTSFCSHNQSSL